MICPEISFNRQKSRKITAGDGSVTNSCGCAFPCSFHIWIHRSSVKRELNIEMYLHSTQRQVSHGHCVKDFTLLTWALYGKLMHWIDLTNTTQPPTWYILISQSLMILFILPISVNEQGTTTNEYLFHSIQDIKQSSDWRTVWCWLASIH